MAVIFTIIGVTGNLLTIAGLYRIPKLRQKATTKFVISLALSDFLFSAINTPMNAALYIQKKSFQIGMFSEIINLSTIFVCTMREKTRKINSFTFIYCLID